MSEVVIKAENISKQYQLGKIGYGTLKHDIQAWWARLRGKDDPHAIIGQGRKKELNEDFWALKDVSFEIKQGESVGIIGKNGAGKSTLLKILSRTTAPTSGNIFIKGKIASLLEVGTGFHPDLTGRENIYLNGAILGMKKREIDKKFDEIVDFSGIEQFIDTPVKRYSSGMYVRLAFAVAAHLESDILILDEVLAVGDVEFQKKCLGKMDDVATKQGRTVIFVSHNMGAINGLCEHTVLLVKGSLCMFDLTSKVISYYNSSYSNRVSLSDVDFSNDNIGDEYVKLLKGSIVPVKGKDINNLTIYDSFDIVMQYQIIKKNYQKMIPIFHIVTENRIQVFSGIMPDVQFQDTGTYEVSCKIPSNLLNEGTYLIGLEITSNGHNCWKVNFSERDVLSVKIIDPMDENSGRYNYTGVFPGVVRPKLQWTSKRI